jgi:hypothetical protein
MKVARVLCLCVVLIAVGLAGAAPAPDRGGKGKLAALKERLPGTVEAWSKAQGLDSDFTVVLRRVRAVDDAEVKLAVHLRRKYKGNRVDSDPYYILNIILKYYDGLWTATRYEFSRPSVRDEWHERAHYLMDAIDEAAEQ